MQKEEKEPLAEQAQGRHQRMRRSVRRMPQATCRAQEVNRGFFNAVWQVGEDGDLHGPILDF
jgi:hypothetical protein